MFKNGGLKPICFQLLSYKLKVINKYNYIDKSFAKMVFR